MQNRTMSDEELRQLVRSTVNETLLGLGLESSNPLALQRDLQFLRQWRQSTEAVRTKAMITVVGFVVTAVCGILWMLFKPRH